ncbi:MAG TPA: hypothetical protein VFZ89_18310 [Solirubrobacteraceae bacterium]
MAALAACELHVLRRVPRRAGYEALRLAVVELGARGALTVDRGSTKLGLLLVPAMPSEPLDGALAALARAIGDAPVAPRAIGHTVAVEWDGPDAFVAAEIEPRLVDQGLVRSERRGPLREQRLVRTADGEDLVGRLEVQLQVFDGPFRGWLKDDPAEASAFLNGCDLATMLLAPGGAKLLARYLRGGALDLLDEAIDAAATIDGGWGGEGGGGWGDGGGGDGGGGGGDGS